MHPAVLHTHTHTTVLLISVVFHQTSIKPLQSGHLFVKTNCMKTSTVSITSKHDTVRMHSGKQDLEILTPVSNEITLFWGMTPSVFVDGYQHLCEICYLNLQERSIFNLEDGSSKLLQNTHTYLTN